MTRVENMGPSAASKSLLASALAYAKRGWRVAPIHGPILASDPGATDAIACTCRKGADCPSIGKHPRITAWQDAATVDPAVIRRWFDSERGNVGVVMGAASGLVDIETDPRNGGDDSFLDLIADLGPLPETCSFRSGGGGVHRLFRYPDGRTLHKRKGWRKGVDVLAGDNSFAVVPPSMHYTGRRYEWIDQREPVELPEAWAIALEMRDAPEPSTSGEKSVERMLWDAGSDKPGDRYSADGDHVALLERFGWKLDHTDGDNEHWTRPGKDAGTSATWHIGRRIFYPFSTSVEGLEDGRGYSLFSLRGRLEFGGSYEACAAAVRSEGYGNATKDAEGEPIEPEAAERSRLLDADKATRAKLAIELEAAGTIDELSTLVDKIRALELTEATREELAHVYQSEAKRHGYTYTLADCRLAMFDPEAEARRAKKRAKDEGWLDGWVYLQEGEAGRWLNLVSGASLAVAVFNTSYEPKLLSPLMRAEGKIRPPWAPTSWALNLTMAPMASGARYMPGEPTLYVDRVDGLTYANTWRAGSGDVADPMAWDAAEVEAIATWQAHVEWMLGADAGALLWQFLAWVYRNPKKRPHWCYTIIGPEGIGKSALLAMMGAVLGRRNVGTVSKAEMSEPKYTGWAEGVQLRAIEELMIAFQKRDTQTALMDAIGNDTVRIVKKGANGYQARNVTAYLAFTNSKNPLILTSGDRRYYVTQTAYGDESFIDALGGREASAAYYAKLFASASDLYAPALRGYLASIDLAGFDAMRAPESATKAALVEASRSELEVRIRDLIASDDAEARWITAGAINASALGAVMGDVPPQSLGRELREMGYERTDNLRVYERETAGRWWVNKSVLKRAGIKAGVVTRMVRLYLERPRASGTLGDAQGQAGNYLEK